MHHWLHEIPHSILHLEKGIVVTAKALFTRPAMVIGGYLEGKRRYYNPLNYILVLGVLVAVFSSFSHIDVVDQASMKQGSKDTSESFEAGKNEGLSKDAQQKALLKAEQKQKEMDKILEDLGHLFNSKFTYLNLFLLPFFALGAFLVYRKDGKNYAEHLVINAYIVGQSMLFVLVGLMVQAMVHFLVGKSWDMVIGYMSTGIFMVYLLWVYTQLFSANRGIMGWLKAFWALCVSYLFQFVAVVLIIGIFVVRAKMGQGSSH